MDAKEVLKHYQNFAVIGVTTNQDKFGYKIYQRLKELGKNVYGVSPVYKEIDEVPTYSNLSAINNQIDVAVFIVNPKFGIDYVNECSSLGIKHIWLQPGTYDDNLISLIDTRNLNYYQNCVLVESQGW